MATRVPTKSCVLEFTANPDYYPPRFIASKRSLVINFSIQLGENVLPKTTVCDRSWRGRGGRDREYDTEGMLNVIHQIDAEGKDSFVFDPPCVRFTYPCHLKTVAVEYGVQQFLPMDFVQKNQVVLIEHDTARLTLTPENVVTLQVPLAKCPVIQNLSELKA